MSATVKTDHALERLVFFSDAVFAIAITLLVIEVHVPELPKGSPDALYWRALYDLIPSLAGYFISFAVVGVFWVSHHRAFCLASRYSPTILGWNLGLLAVIAFMPFTTAFYTHNMAQRVPILVYCFALLLAGLLNMIVVRVATGSAMVDPSADRGAIAYARKRSLAVTLGTLSALVLSYFEPRYGQIALASIGIWRRIILRYLR
ncbi:MAG: hypothetical protein JWP15_1347 [Alphaproteobacteria bacterium]|nr:hypothetical protein [Alphaproteobacteria bacterium]